MRQPIDELEWPQAANLRWFEGKSVAEILESENKRFCEQLKQNALKIVVRANKSFQEKVDAWQYMKSHRHLVGAFFKAIIRLALSSPDEFQLTTHDRYQLLTFFNYAFNSIEVDFVNEQVRKYLPLSIWCNLSETKRTSELSKLSKRIRLAWAKLGEQDKRLDAGLLKERLFERKFIYNYLKQFLRILQSSVVVVDDDDDDDDGGGPSPEAEAHEAEMETEGGEKKSNGQREKSGPRLTINSELALYCQRFIEFIIDIESQLPLRRFFHALLEDTHLIYRCQLSDLARHKSPEGQLFNQLVELLLMYSRYELDLMTGEPLTDVEVLRKHEQNIARLQKILWSKYEHLKKFAIKPVKAIDNPTALYKIVTSFDSKEELFEFLKSVGLVDEESLADEADRDNALLMASILMSHYRRYESQMKKINSIPLFPNESVIWDTNLVPDQYYNYEYPLALPKLNLQFLTMSDYLLRNFMLFKNESTYEIRQDIEDGIYRSKCRWTSPESTGGGGGSGSSSSSSNFATGPKQRMALIIKSFSIVEVAKPALGEKCPSKVRAKVILNMDYVRPEWRREWEQLRRHDTCFLVSFRRPEERDELAWPEGSFPARHGIKYVRGCEIEGLLDGQGKLVDENIETPKFTGNLRTYLVCMDCNQYQIDQEALVERKTVVYDKFHLMVRRKPEKNNFKGVLETIRHIINTKFVVPEWLRDLLIGFGDPSGATPAALRGPSGQPLVLDYNDTFLDLEHLRESFRALKPNYSVVLEPSFAGDESKKEEEEAASAGATVAAEPPFRVGVDDSVKRISVIPYRKPSLGPYPTVVPKTNGLKFTPAQVGAITSGLQPGLTMVVGPPGTGKTDVAVQILANLYHSNPEQRTLIVTHSNQALNQIFGKMIELDVQEHHLLRMGHGEEDLDSARDFSRRGRVRHVLQRRLELLARANRLARSLGLSQGEGLSCQSAEYFYSYHIEPRWSAYLKAIAAAGPDLKLDSIGTLFPFGAFFDDAPQPLFAGRSREHDLETAHSCFRYIEHLFSQLREFRPFEIFSTASDRSQYLLIRVAKIIAMTCTHAGLRRKELVEMNFQYDNILMEETAQILEVETTIPLLLQSPENGVNRLKRWIMIGDHNQLPPIIQNSAFQKFSNMEQSLFARFIRLGVPHTQLDAQGRARPGLCDLYRWRYRSLRELPVMATRAEFKRANAGFQFDYQLINVADLHGTGESTPMPHYYQNRAEAEFVVATYKYMRALGYASDKITLLTTYNGQKQLLRDLIERECARDAFLERPSKVTTVDKFQGQQNDFVLLSLVRTKTVGHLRDIRRLVVAMSRARLGLYIFARVALFSGSLELQPSMRLLLKRPQELCLLPDERFPTTRSSQGRQDAVGEANSDGGPVRVVKSLDDMQQLVEKLYAGFVEQQARSARLMEAEAEDDGDDSSSASSPKESLADKRQDEPSPTNAAEL